MTPIRILLATAALFAVTVPVHATIEIYDVDPAYRQEVYQTLRRLLTDQPPPLAGRVQLLPNGQIVVDTAREDRQAEIAALLEAIANSEPEETPAVTLRYWILHGAPGENDAPGLPPTLDSVVRELETVHGDLGVEILDAASVSATSGERGSLNNDRWRIWQSATVNGDRVNTEIQIQHELQDLSVNLSLQRGEFVVLGAGSSGHIVDGGVLALVVNWPEAE